MLFFSLPCNFCPSTPPLKRSFVGAELLRKIALRLDEEVDGAYDLYVEALASFPDALVLSKPRGHGCAGGPPHVAELLQGLEPPIFRDASLDHGLVHRLDRETSGALLVAKSPRSAWGKWEG